MFGRRTANSTSFAFAQRYGMLLESIEGDRAIVVARQDAADQAWLEVRRFLQRPIVLKRCSEEEFALQLERHYGGGDIGGKEASIGMDLDVAENLSGLPK